MEAVEQWPAEQSPAQQWPALEYEKVAWERSVDEVDYIPKSRRRAISGSYRAAVPLSIASRAPQLPRHLEVRIGEVVAMVSRFDERQAGSAFNMPALLLRSESAASSQIEQLTSSVRNIALAELSDKTPRNARLIAGNVAAMRTALALSDDLTVDTIRSAHEALVSAADVDFGGCIRQEQVWIGGTPYSPHGAVFVPPVASRVQGCLDDLIAFARRDDLDPVTKAAICHAQFETIHPFVDGNGRTGRVILAKMLRRDGLLTHTTLPVSAGLLHDVDAYMDALISYHDGDVVPIVEQVVQALELAVAIGMRMTAMIAQVIECWEGRITQRDGARIHELPALLVEQPVVNSRYVAERLGVSQRAARTILEQACAYEMVRPIGGAQRSVFYQSPDLIDVMETISSLKEIRRLLRS